MTGVLDLKAAASTTVEIFGSHTIELRDARPVPLSQACFNCHSVSRRGPHYLAFEAKNAFRRLGFCRIIINSSLLVSELMLWQLCMSRSNAANWPS